MIQLPPIFSSGALYQQNTSLTLRGTGTVNSLIIAEIRLWDGRIFSNAECCVDKEGCFSLTLQTPPASVNTCKILLWEKHLPENILSLDNILFGELWLASGQSNMELLNSTIDHYQEYLSAMKDLPLRIYCQNTLCNEPFIEEHLSLDMPIEPVDTLSGCWKSMAEIAETGEASAVASAFIGRLYQLYAEKGQAIPIGFLNCNMGGTFIETWLPFKDLDEDDETAVGSVIRPHVSTWNTFAAANFQQATGLYNLKVYPLRGLKIKGILWYQGEANISRPGCKERYKRYLERYYRTYRDLFAAEENFPMIISQLYPFSYDVSGECRMSCINQAIAEMARDQRTQFTAVSIYDLSPIWAVDPFCHPIHPTNKYPLGERMAETYIRGITAPTLRQVTREGKRLLLTFDNLGGTLQIKGKRLYGLYIRGEHTTYLEAEGECLDPSTLAVWHPQLERPVHVAYQCASMACDGNLHGKYLPVASFSTEDPYHLRIEGKPWLHTEKPAGWFCDCPFDTPLEGYFDYFMHPVWQPVEESEICTDPVFFRNIASLRITGKSSRFGAFTKSRYYNRLDLQHYQGLQFLLFNAHAVSGEFGLVQAELTFVPESGTPYVITCRADQISEVRYGWAAFSINWGELPEDFIERLTLTFDVGQNVYRFVNIDKLVLIPKEHS